MERNTERLVKENEILREILRETNQRLEEKIHEFSLFRVVADTINRSVTKANSLKLLLSKMIDIIGASNGSIMLIDEKERQLHIEAASGSKDAHPTHPTFPVGRGVAGWVAMQGKPIIIDDVSHDDKFYRNEAVQSQIRALLCMPIAFENKTIGVLNVSSEQPDAFSLNTERILRIIAGQVGIAIANTRSWEEQKQKELALQEKNQQLLEVKGELETAQAQLMKSQRLEALKQMAVSLHHEINNPLATIYSCTQLLESHLDALDESGKKTLNTVQESCRQIKDIVYKLSNLQDIVLTNYVADRKMIDIDKSYSEPEKGENDNSNKAPSQG